MAVNYSTWTVSKLEKEKEKIDKAISRKEGKERQKALADMKAAAKKNGFDVSDLIGDFDTSGPGRPRGKKKASARKGTGKVAPKYRNPNDPSVTWSGRGRKPKWVEAHLEKHNNLDAVTI